jgi:DNA mismatch repair protein MutS
MPDITPMRQQYDVLKKKYKDCILLYRLGDFYEGFENDAKILSKVLGIVLTSRGKYENRRPMAGIPYHALNNYLSKLVKAGYKVAIAEQLEEPQKGKKVVRRDVIKIVTAGTLLDEKFLNEGKNNFLVALAVQQSKKYTTWGLSSCDLTTGEFSVSEFYSKDKNEITMLLAELKRLNPSEVLISKEYVPLFQKSLQIARFQIIDDTKFDFQENYTYLTTHFKTKNLKGFGIEEYQTGVIAAGIVLFYLTETQKTALQHITRIQYKKNNDDMMLDEDTIRSLELVEPIRNDNKSTLLYTLDHCLTPMGKRKLYKWIIHPLFKNEDIEYRLNGVNELYKRTDVLQKVRIMLDNIYDIERILGRIGTESANGRDLLGLKSSLNKALKVYSELLNFSSPLLLQIKKSLGKIDSCKTIIDLIEKSIVDDPPFTITEGNLIKEGFNPDLDTIFEATNNGKKWIIHLQEEEIQRTKIPSLKVRFNKVFGYYIEISKSNLSKIPADYIRKQTLVNAERFITPELKEKEDLILNAEERSLELQYKIFVQIRTEITKYIKIIQEIADAIATLDVLCSFAYHARNNDYCKPTILPEEDGVLKIKNGRHPVLEGLKEEKFIPNDVFLNTSKDQIAIITGPNMAGKSTYIRQVALIVLLAQIGSFVPAHSMKFEPVDRIFTRIGASDNLTKGESTFLVEMNETANILNNATKRSLIILDEVGRGTSTYDGVAIAWAVAEYLHYKIGAKTLFATHYHELVDLEKYLPRIKNYNVAVKESGDKIIFLRKIEKGGTDKSYGVHVAQFAGIPENIIKRAKEILLSLEQEGMFEVKHIETELTEKKEISTPQIPLLEHLPEDPVIKELKNLNINQLTPLDALKKLNEFVNKVHKGRKK